MNDDSDAGKRFSCLTKFMLNYAFNRAVNGEAKHNFFYLDASNRCNVFPERAQT